MKFTTSEFLPNVDRIDTDPPGPYWLMVDRTGQNWETSLRGASGRINNAQIATFNSYTCYGSDIEKKLLWLLNKELLNAEPQEASEVSPKTFLCPQCGSDDLRVVVTTVAELIQESDGNLQTEACSDHEWDNTSTMMCNICELSGETQEFMKGATEMPMAKRKQQ